MIRNKVTLPIDSMIPFPYIKGVRNDLTQQETEND
jgi:hypothetical protein